MYRYPHASDGKSTDSNSSSLDLTSFPDQCRASHTCSLWREIVVNSKHLRSLRYSYRPLESFIPSLHVHELLTHGLHGVIRFGVPSQFSCEIGDGEFIPVDCFMGEMLISEDSEGFVSRPEDVSGSRDNENQDYNDSSEDESQDDVPNDDGKPRVRLSVKPWQIDEQAKANELQDSIPTSSNAVSVWIDLDLPNRIQYTDLTFDKDITIREWVDLAVDKSNALGLPLNTCRRLHVEFYARPMWGLLQIDYTVP